MEVNVKCMKCNKMRKIDGGRVETTPSGRTMFRGLCPKCGANVCKFVKKPPEPTTEPTAPAVEASTQPSAIVEERPAGFWKRLVARIYGSPKLASVRAWLYDGGKRTRPVLPKTEVGAARPRRASSAMGSKKVYLLEKVDGHVQPFVPRPLTDNITPSDLYGACHWATQAGMFRIEPTWMQKIQAGSYLAIIAVLMLTLFMIVLVVLEK